MKIFKMMPFLGIFALFLALGVGHVFAACDDGSMEYGDSCEDRFRSGDEDPIVFAFAGEEGDVVSAVLTWDEGDDATGTLIVAGPSVEEGDFELQEADEDDGGEVALENLELPADGVYLIGVLFTSDNNVDFEVSLDGDSGGGGNNNNRNRGGGDGLDVECEDGTVVENGVQLIINMRANFNYTVTAVGVDGFDPAIAVGTVDDLGLSCSDDSRDAEDFEADLPTTGRVRSSDTSAQVVFSHNIDDFANISIVTGSANGDSGDFVLIVEGLAVTSADGAGDPYVVQLTPNMTTAAVPMTIYMLGAERALDPFVSWVTDFENFEFFTDNDGNPIYCDDGGNANTCWGDSDSLDGSSVSTSGGDVDGDDFDSMLSVDLSGFADLDFEGDGPFFLDFVLGSYNQSSTGNYVAVFHFGVGG